MSVVQTQGEYEFYNHAPQQGDIGEEILLGLALPQKKISPKYFYDAYGSHLFEQITELKEYYLTRTEMALFDEHLATIGEQLGNDLCVVEYGSGSSKKIRKLLETLAPTAYVPVDISAQHLQENAKALHKDFPNLNVYPVCADITQPFDLPEEVADLTKVAFYPGSSIGNFEPDLATEFLAKVRQSVGLGGILIIGVDRKKDVAVLEAAYNDKAGVTANFNLNVLSHLNETLSANFDLNQFEHVANYNEELGCIQMFLRSLRDQQVTVAGKPVSFGKDELIHTENSFKYSPAEVEVLCGKVGFSLSMHFADTQQYFSLYVFEGSA